MMMVWKKLRKILATGQANIDSSSHKQHLKGSVYAPFFYQYCLGKTIVNRVPSSIPESHSICPAKVCFTKL
jgi:hypothetical protein